MENEQNYIGIKMIKARPMTRGDYNKYRGWEIPENENPADDGYLVVYSDSYQSWSPKDVFEKHYLAMGTITDRFGDKVVNNSKITEDMVEKFMGKVTSERYDEKTTLVKAKTITGFRQIETSSCVDPENYSHEIGTLVGTKRIKDTIWKCLGFVLQWAKDGLDQ